MAIIFGNARVDENGNTTGGTAGDQTGSEVCTQDYYMHALGWYCLRAASDTYAAALATAMQEACDNDNIGYDQSGRLTVWAELQKAGTLGAITTPCEADCSSLVRCCVYQATGTDPGNFTTATEVSMLEATGIFEDKFSVTDESELYNGDILVTKTQGHTVIVVSGRERSWTATGTATASEDGISVKSGAGENYSTLGTLNEGNRFEVDGTTSGDYVRVKVTIGGVDVIGWVHIEGVVYDGDASAASSTASTWAATGTATATTEVNVRSGAGVDYSSYGMINAGDRFEVDGTTSGDYVHVMVVMNGENVIGWIHEDYVAYDGAPTETSTTDEWTATGTATATQDGVSVQTEAGENYDSYGTLNAGNRFEVDGTTSGDWVHVKVTIAGADVIGWIYKDYVAYDGATTSSTTSTTVDPAASYDASLAGKYTVVNCTKLNLRAGAGTDKTILTTMTAGDTVQNYGYYTEVSGVKWLYVKYGTLTGFASENYLNK